MPLDKSHTWDWNGLRLEVTELSVNGEDVGAQVAGIGALTALTDSTGVVTPNNTIENVPAATAAVTDTTAASLTSTNASLTAIENSLADLTAKVNAIIAAAAA